MLLTTSTICKKQMIACFWRLVATNYQPLLCVWFSSAIFQIDNFKFFLLLLQFCKFNFRTPPVASQCFKSADFQVFLNTSFKITNSENVR